VELLQPRSLLHLLTAQDSAEMPVVYNQVTSGNTQQRRTSSENTLNDRGKNVGLSESISSDGSASAENRKSDKTTMSEANKTKQMEAIWPSLIRKANTFPIEKTKKIRISLAR
jgi:hypothetical protein